jgi:hypothetical protein
MGDVRKLHPEWIKISQGTDAESGRTLWLLGFWQDDCEMIVGEYATLEQARAEAAAWEVPVFVE